MNKTRDRPGDSCNVRLSSATASRAYKFSRLVMLLASLPAWAAEKTRFHVDDYQIDAVLNPHDHKITARAKVKLTALEDLNIATFNLHNDLRLSKVTDRRARP